MAFDEDFLDEIDARIEAALKKFRPDVKQLPLAGLTRWLDESPTAPPAAEPPGVAGKGTLTWPGANATTTAQAFNHTLGRTPTNVQLTPQDVAGVGVVAMVCTAKTATTITVQAENVAGFQPLNTATTPFDFVVR